METKTTQCHPKPLVNATCLLGEKGCYKDGKCHYMGNCENKVLTNADRIRAMNDEELAKAIASKAYTGACNDFDIPHNGKCCGNCEKCDAIINWLKQPAEGE